MFVPARLRHRFVDLRTEGAGPVRETTAVALGVVIGCLPVYGFHLLICWTAGYALGLNRLKMYVAANISNPFVAPWLVFAEVQAGAWLRRGAFHALTMEALKTTGVAVFATDVLVGSVVVGSALGALAAAGTYAVLRSTDDDAAFAELVRRAADRYAGTSITAWEFARGKLRGDPVYRATLSSEIPGTGPLLDIGCGQGLALALLAEARRCFEAGTWPRGWAPPPLCEPMIGIEPRRRVASKARVALAGDAEIIEGDARTLPLDGTSAVLLFDVLHLMRPDEQEKLLAELAIRLLPGGVVLVRDVDASGGWRFRTVWLLNRVKAIVVGTWRQSFHPRTEDEWRACFERCGFCVEARPMAGTMPFANVLFRLTVTPGASGSTGPPTSGL